MIVIVPIYYIVVTSLRSQAGFFTANPLALPAHPTLDNYAEVLRHDFVRYLANSVVVTVAAVAVTLAVSLMAAYVIVRGSGRFVRMTSRCSCSASRYRCRRRSSRSTT